MFRKASVALVTALVLAAGSAAVADEYLETTGNRSDSFQAIGDYYLQGRVPLQYQHVRADQVQAPAIVPLTRSEQAWLDRAAGIPGQ